MKKLILLGLALGLFSISQAQYRYNFFVGEDADLVQTTHKGFGSVGWDFTSQRLYYKVGEGRTQFFAGLGLGLTVRKFRFQNNYQFVNQGDHVDFIPDDPNHEYVDGFFSYSKSKLVTTWVRVFPDIGVSFFDEKFAISAGPIADVLIQTKHKRKYKVDGEKQKFVKRSNNDYMVNNFQYGIRGSIGSYGFGLYGIYMLNPFFENTLTGSPNVQTAEIGFYMRFALNGDS